MNAWYAITIVAIIVALLRRDLMREMILAGLLALPILLLKPLISSNFLQIAENNGGLWLFSIEKIVLSFSFGALASSVYEIFFHKKVTPLKHPLRKKLIWLFCGPALFIIMAIFFHQALAWALLLGLSLNLAIVLVIRKDLVWDTFFSGFFMGILYFAIFAASYKGFPGDIRNLWFSEVTVGITAFSLPIEELLCVFLFGAFWGPLYIAIKDQKLFNKSINLTSAKND